VRFLFLALQVNAIVQKSGEVFFASLPVRLWQEKYREPDLVFVKHGRSECKGYPEGADLVVEIVSQSVSDRRRDMKTKVTEYEQAAISEYWIVDPIHLQVLVYQLKDSRYEVTTFACGQIATSGLIVDFEVDVSELFAAANDAV